MSSKRSKEAESRRLERKREEAQLLVNEMKRRPCADCGNCFDPVAMDFDHRPGTDKRFDISDLAYRGRVARLLDEMAKCDLVCANCHRIRTFLRRGSRCRVKIDRQAPPVVSPTATDIGSAIEAARAHRSASTKRRVIVPETRDRVIGMLAALRARFGSWLALAKAMNTSRERITSALQRGHVSAELAAHVAAFAGLDVDALDRGDPVPGHCPMCNRGDRSEREAA